MIGHTAPAWAPEHRDTSLSARNATPPIQTRGERSSSPSRRTLPARSLFRPLPLVGETSVPASSEEPPYLPPPVMTAPRRPAQPATPPACPHISRPQPLPPTNRRSAHFTKTFRPLF